MKKCNENDRKNEKLPEGIGEALDIGQINDDLNFVDELVDDLYYLISLIYLLDAFHTVIKFGSADVPKEFSDMLGSIRSIAGRTVDKWDAYANMEK